MSTVKRMVSIFGVVCILMPAVSRSYAQGQDKAADFLEDFRVPRKNYVNNGSFNRGLEGWHFFKKHGGSVVREGQNNEPCFKLSGSFDDGIYLYNIGTKRESGWNINLKESMTYTLTVDLKAEDLSKIDPNKVLYIVNAGWTRAVKIGPGSATTDGWVKKTIRFTAPEQTRPNATRYSLVLYWPHGAGGTIWMDNIQIEKGKQTEYCDRWNYPALSMAQELKQIYSKALSAQKMLTGEFSDSVLANELKAKVSQYIVRIRELGAKIKDYENLSNAELDKMPEDIKSISDKLGLVMCPVWLKNAYLNSDMSDFPETIDPLGVQKLTCYVNETRNIGLMVTNLSGKNIDARLTPQIFIETKTQQRIPGREFITIYNTPLIRGYKAKEKRFTDPLPEANIIDFFPVTAGETRQAVISFSTRNLDPGSYRGSVLMDPFANKTLTQGIEFELEVLPVRLPDKVPVDICPLGARFLRPEEARRLGHSVLTLSMQSIFPNLDRDGRLQPVNYSHIDQKIRRARAVDPECKFMMIFSVGIRFINRANRKGFKWPDERLKIAWKTWVKDLCDHLESIGVDRNHFYLQVVDEPSPAEAKKAAELQNLAKSAVPDLLTTSYMTGFRSDGSCKAFYDNLDYPAPVVKTLRKGKCAAYFQNEEKQVNMYDCAENSETLNPVTYSRLMAWRAWKHNLVGWSYWYRDDRSPNWSCAKYMSIVYPIRDGDRFFTGTPIWPEDKYVISRRWLAMEAGYQDYKALYLLKKALDEAKKTSGPDSALVKETEDFLAQAADKALALDDPAKYPRGMAEGADPDILDKMMESMVRLTAGLLSTDTIRILKGPDIDTRGKLKLKTDRPVAVRVSYLVEGELPWQEVVIDEPAVNHVIVLPKGAKQTINKCYIRLTDSLGRVTIASPFIIPKLSVDSIFPGYEMECLINGERVPAAQYWRGKTWISEATNTEHWVKLEWPELRRVNKVMVCWMTFGGLPTAYKVQYQKEGDGEETWVDIGSSWQGAQKAFEVIKFRPVATRAVRIIQKSGGGNHLTPSMMGISELEVY